MFESYISTSNYAYTGRGVITCNTGTDYQFYLCAYVSNSARMYYICSKNTPQSGSHYIEITNEGLHIVTNGLSNLFRANKTYNFLISY
jgi:hypothetical protein